MIIFHRCQVYLREILKNFSISAAAGFRNREPLCNSAGIGEDSKTGSASGAEGEPVCPAGHIGRENQQKPFKSVCERFVRWNRFRREIVEGERRLQKPFPGGHARRARLQRGYVRPLSVRVAAGIAGAEPRKNFICAEVSSEFRSCLNSITQDLPLTAASVPTRPMQGRWSDHTLIMLPGLLNVCFVRDYFLSSVLSTISWKTCPLSEVSTVRAARSLKRRMISTVPPIENHTVEITPTIPGTSR